MKKHLIFLITWLSLLAPPLVAQADILVIVNPDNPIKSLDQQQIQRLFLGRMNLFPGSNIKVSAIDQNNSSAAYHHFYKKVIEISQSKLKRYRAYHLFSGKGQLPKELKNTKDVVKYVSTSTHAIAYIDEQDLTDSVKVVYKIAN